MMSSPACIGFQILVVVTGGQGGGADARFLHSTLATTAHLHRVPSVAAGAPLLAREAAVSGNECLEPLPPPQQPSAHDR